MSRHFTNSLMAMALAGLYGSGYAQSTVYQYEYDNVGNVTKITNANNVATLQNYDVHNRLQTQTDGNSKVTGYDYDGQHRLIKVTDARSLSTLYSIDGLGNQLSQISPDTGVTTTTVDVAGNILTRTDAKSQTTSYAYDVLNRITRITYHDGSIINYSYDQGVNAKGRLTQITDANSTIQYSYDSRGRALTDTRTINTVSYVTRYQYDNAGRISSLTYPNGRKVSYTRDSLGRITQIDSSKDGLALTLVSQVIYRPFGGVQSYHNSAGQTATRSFDNEGRIASYTLNNQVQAVTYDAANRITAINDVNNSNRQASYGYDNLDRLTSYTTPQTSQSFTYDAVGNRSTKTTGAANTNYTYASTSNRLTQVADSQSNAIVSDANGSITNNGNAQFTYDTRGRMTAVTTSIGVVQYTINALGQRVQKAVPANGSNAATSTLYHYDGGGKLISERTGQSDVDYIYLGDIPVAVIK
ncbi:RHS repeat protein [Undibacterium sp. CY18W]|uniref:RHS repeat protein n=1 Tax=Undibacterium hunanense TaxID=2762292 RepID=A0ABR6ZVF1_9BURK|nr:RHS repeat protein [Undibacterium hunanense]MBC3919485.1 RHS repeat protein [Undibacterium hunanense]